VKEYCDDAKLAGRHRMVVATGTLVFTAGLAGTGVAALQARRATEAAQQAQVVKQFVIDAFRASVQDDPLAEGGDASAFERMLERNAQLIERSNEPRLQAELYGTVARVLLDEKRFAKAAVYARRQSEVLAGLNAPAQEQADAALQLSEALSGSGDAAGAEEQARQALKWAAEDKGLFARVRDQVAAMREAASAPGASAATGAGFNASPER